MTQTTKRIIAALSTVIFVCGIAWLSGFDFDHRGVWTAYTALVASIFGIFAYNYPFQD